MENAAIKLVSWNVNGLRACMGKGFSQFLEEEAPDILCLQETKMQKEQADFDFPGYFEYWNSATTRKGYSGTAIFSKKKPLSVTCGMGLEEFDGEGRVIAAEYEDFILVTVYTPNSQRDLVRIGYRMQFEDAFREYLTALREKKPVIVCGDMNVAHRPIDLKMTSPISATRATPTRSGASSPSCWPPALWTPSATSIRSRRGPTPGGATCSTPGRTTPAGALTISWPTSGCCPVWRTAAFSPR